MTNYFLFKFLIKGSHPMGIRLTALTPAQVKKVILLAQSKATKETLEKLGTSYTIARSDAADLELQKLVSMIDRFSPIAKSELMTLVWLGMGTIDNDQNSWEELLHAAQEEQINDIPEEIALLPHLHEFLHRGLDKVS